MRGRSSVGRAPQWHCGGRRFEPDRLHQYFYPQNVFHFLKAICFRFLPLLSLLVSCGDKDIEQEAREMLEKNNSIQSSKKDENVLKGLTRSVDGLQFKRQKEGNTQESIGFSETGKVSYLGDFKDGKPEGIWTTFFPDGKPRWKGRKKNGLNDGEFTLWYPDGRRKMEGFYKEGKKQGRSVSWHPNGEKWQEQWHQNGTPSGVWKTWNAEGVLIKEEIRSANLD